MTLPRTLVAQLVMELRDRRSLVLVRALRPPRRWFAQTARELKLGSYERRFARELHLERGRH